MVVLAARGLTPLQVVETLAARAGTSGLAEKAARKKTNSEGDS
jgi:phosphoribosyl-ATP pyrophosphohydrolase